MGDFSYLNGQMAMILVNGRDKLAMIVDVDNHSNLLYLETRESTGNEIHVILIPLLDDSNIKLLNEFGELWGIMERIKDLRDSDANHEQWDISSAEKYLFYYEINMCGDICEPPEVQKVVDSNIEKINTQIDSSINVAAIAGSILVVAIFGVIAFVAIK